MFPQGLSHGELVVVSFLFAAGALAIASMIGFTITYFVMRERAPARTVEPAAGTRPVPTVSVSPAGTVGRPTVAA